MLTRQITSNTLLSGVVVDNEDTEKGNRVKVSLDNMTNEISKEDLPYYPILSSAGPSNNSSMSVPQIGAKVLVRLLDETIYNGVVVYSIPSKPSE